MVTGIEHVNDTARWVAANRARETARRDAVFRDELAERMSGQRGRAIADLAPWQSRNGWPVVARTKLIDDFVLACVADGCDCIVNLAAGFDTRPYRLALPPSLRFIEADLPALIEQKECLLEGDRPRCQVIREAVDLSDAAARRAFLDGALGGARKALAISEGLLCYLDEAEVRSLSMDLVSRSALRWWTFDVFSPAVLRMMQSGMQLASAPMRFAPASGVEFFEAQGWQVLGARSLFHEAARLHRLPLLLRPFAWLPEPDPRQLGDKRWSAVVRLSRASSRRAQ